MSPATRHQLNPALLFLACALLLLAGLAVAVGYGYEAGRADAAVELATTGRLSR